MSLATSDFPSYFKAIHGHEPFPWQTRLAHRVLDAGPEGGWPDVLAVPTGCGKTSTLDVALFALAAQPERFPRRVVMVIDRRVVVDQGALHAERIGEVLRKTNDPVARAVAEALRSLWGGKPDAIPFQTAVLRGGMPRDDAWAKRPDRPVLAVSTVDQVGSRLLFRGYGVSPRMASVHAGLLGHDTLFLLDEVHLAVPFAETLLALRERWRGFYPNELPDRFGVVRLSATPGLVRERDRVLTLEPGGEDDEHPRLKPRLLAHKPTLLKPVAVGGRDEDVKRGALVKACAEAALEMIRGDDLLAGRPRTIGVIVNRVATAREIADRLAEGAGDEIEVCLLTGRMRPLDRDALLENLLPRIRAGRARDVEPRPLIVVATQCIEAGADFDFDGLITECASLDALRQRFGRLDRLGERHAQGLLSPAVILARSDQLAESADADPIYGGALRATWAWLGELGQGCDFGIRHLPDPTAERLATLVAPRLHAPILLPAHLDAWNQTHPRPEPDPEVSLWLHGPERGEPEVQIVWRADVTTDKLQEASTEGAALEALVDRLAACPPTPAEALALPLSAARRWLRGQLAPTLADAPMKREEEPEEREVPHARPALSWSGDDSRVVTAADLWPGMTVVVPAGYGGIRRDNWDPATQEPIADCGDLAQWRRYRRATLRLCGATLPAELCAGAGELPAADGEITAAELRSRVRAWLDDLPSPLPKPWDDIIAALRDRPRIIVHADGGLTLVGRKAGRESVSTEDDGASLTGREVSLARHSQDVWLWARDFASRLGLPDKVGEDLVLAAWLHDAGKADPRFQKWLVGGSAVRLALLDEPLAKSAQTLRDRRAMVQARRQAGYPEGYRHELLSVVMVAANEDLLAKAHDRELVLHLVGAHHGWCRPFAALVDHPEDLLVTVAMENGPRGLAARLQAGTRHRLARLDSGVTDRFWTLTERYGWWGLAWLEAILRLADHRASALGRGEEQ